MRGGQSTRAAAASAAVVLVLLTSLVQNAMAGDPTEPPGRSVPVAVHACRSPSSTSMVIVGRACGRANAGPSRLPLSGPLSEWPAIRAAESIEQAAGGGGEWQKVARTSPKRRAYPQWVYDSTNARSVLFGGYICPDNSCYSTNETWVFEGTAWTRLHPDTSPPALLRSAIAYDAERGEVVLFGGASCDVTCVATDETWTFDGNTWKKETPAESPPPRYAHSMAYDSEAKRVVMYGGCIVSCPANANDTWTWNGTNWTQLDILPTDAPSPRDSAAMVYDSTHKEIVLFGGEVASTTAGTQSLGDTWTLSGNTWTEETATGPSARFSTAASDAPMSGGVFVGGGTPTGFTYLSDNWLWDGNEWSEFHPESLMPNVAGGAAVFDSGAGQIELVGGSHEEQFIRGSLRDVWTFDGSTWRSLPTPWPQERLLDPWGSMAYDPHTKTTMMIGGLCLYDGFACNEVWSWDGQTWTPMSGEEIPRGGMVAYDHATGKITVAIGRFMFTWDGQSWTRRAVDTFSQAYNNGMASDSSGHLVAFGGVDYSTGILKYPRVTSVWDGTAWSNLELPESPRGRQGGGIAFDPSTGQTVLFGGLNCDDEPLMDSLTKPSCPVLNDTWVWDGEAWNKMEPAHVPTARWLNSLEWDPVHHRVLLYGGMDVDRRILNDAWAWDGSDWTNLNLPPTSPTYFEHGMAIGPDGKMVMFGGQAQNPGRMASETYVLGEAAPFDIPLPDASPSPTSTPTPSASPTPTPSATPTRGTYPMGPNDEYFADQWGPIKISAPAAWQVGSATGFGIKVAVVDSGVDLQHEDLLCPGKLDVVPGSDFVASDGDPDDGLGHGTHVAGIIGACTNNETGIAGVAPDSSLLPVRVLDSQGNGNFDQVAAGIRFAADQGAHVINMSLAGGAESSLPLFDLSAMDAAVQYAVSKGSVIVAAAGNHSSPLCEYPALAQDVVCVGATDSRDLKAWYSGFPNKQQPGAKLVAPGGNETIQFCNLPGEQVLSLWTPEKDPCDEGRLGYADVAGTSMAAPHVSGAAALIYDRLGGQRTVANAQTVVRTLEATADDLGPPGYDPIYGSGRVNALRAVQAIAMPAPTPTGTSSPAPTTDPSVSPAPAGTPMQATPAPSSSGSPPSSPSPAREVTHIAFTDASAESGQFSDTAHLEARLLDAQGMPIRGAELTFELLGADATQTFHARTSAAGVAVIEPTLNDKPGSHQLSVRYAGDASRYQGAADTRGFVIDEEDTSMNLKVAATRFPRRLSAILTDLDAPVGIAGRTIAFYLNGKLLGTGTTDESGKARLFTEARRRGRRQTFEARFAGDDYYSESRTRKLSSRPG
jgi:subtilisin family serine protease